MVNYSSGIEPRNQQLKVTLLCHWCHIPPSWVHNNFNISFLAFSKCHTQSHTFYLLSLTIWGQYVSRVQFKLKPTKKREKTKNKYIKINPVRLSKITSRLVWITACVFMGLNGISFSFSWMAWFHQFHFTCCLM